MAWREVVGYEGYYEVSDCGKVRSVDRVVPDGPNRERKLYGQVMSARPLLRTGHLGLNLSKDGIVKHKLVHRLVASAWIGPCPDGQQVRHGPNGVADNSVSNLSYGTPTENNLDCRRDGTDGGVRVRRSDGKEFASMAIAAEESGCNPDSICHVCKGRRKSAGGWGWEYCKPIDSKLPSKPAGER